MPVSQPQPFRLYLLRHAHAAWADPGERDFDRKLDNAGYAEAEQIAEKAAEKGYIPDLILSSTAVRCRETTDALRRAFNESTEISYVDEMYNAEPAIYLALANGQQNTGAVMLVGHNPTMESVLETLIGRDAMQAALPDGFPTAGLAVLTSSPDGDSKLQWQLVDFITP